MIMEYNLLEQIIQSLQDHFCLEVKINDIHLLSEADRRNCIARLFLSSGNNEKRSVIFKQSLSDKNQKLLRKISWQGSPEILLGSNS